MNGMDPIAATYITMALSFTFQSLNRWWRHLKQKQFAYVVSLQLNLAAFFFSGDRSNLYDEMDDIIISDSFLWKWFWRRFWFIRIVSIDEQKKTILFMQNSINKQWNQWYLELSRYNVTMESFHRFKSFSSNSENSLCFVLLMGMNYCTKLLYSMTIKFIYHHLRISHFKNDW